MPSVSTTATTLAVDPVVMSQADVALMSAPGVPATPTTMAEIEQSPRLAEHAVVRDGVGFDQIVRFGVLTSG